MNESSDNSLLNENDIYYGITTDRVNLRPTQSTKQKEICKIPHGTILRIELSEGEKNKEGTWYPVEYDGHSGYLSSVTFTADLSPVCTGYVSPDSALAQLIAAFNSEASSRRIFDEVHYYKTDPHLTLGFGHFAGGTQDEFIRSMLLNEQMKPIFVNVVAKAFARNPKFVSDARNEGYEMLSIYEEEVYGVEEFLSTINLEKGAVNDSNKDKFPGGGKKNGYWLNDILVDVLKDSIICAWQIKFWIEHTLADAKLVAAKLGLADNYGAVATLVSLRSSGLLDEKAVVSMTEGLDNDSAAMKLWTYYNKAKKPGENPDGTKKPKKIRGRQKAIFSRWYADSWKIVSNETCPQELSDCSYLGKKMPTAADGIAFNVDENKDDQFNSILEFVFE